jgi:L-ascorbate metabolism protein UlaG (beta-lactamase superfamily)
MDKEESMASTKIKWISHAGFQITSGTGKIIYIDPWFENPLATMKLDEVKEAALVLVTHDHFDHVGQAAEIVMKTGALLVANVETARRLQDEAKIPAEKVCYFGYGMNIGGNLLYEGISVTMTQAFHSSATGAPCGYIVRLEDGTILYHAGDTGIFESMKTFGELYPIDMAMLPIGSVFTMDPVQAARGHKADIAQEGHPNALQDLPDSGPGPFRFHRVDKERSTQCGGYNAKSW